MIGPNLDENGNLEVIGQVVKLNINNFHHLLLKTVTLFFIFLQARIYKSEGFKKFMREDLRSLLDIGKKYKKNIITSIFNNEKIENIIKV